ncbi:MAG: ASKHA domain-containing protein [Bryobacteraceae bacterium]|nr:ASKHA domain-containing protein [Bryobacteraceae bacterium]MDW8378838.1 ASKHA domain-containing protein [Bryobacterales bacterium]
MGSLTLFELADSSSIEIPSSCHRQGFCNECIVEVQAGLDQLCDRTPAESFLKDPYRLACQARLLDGAAKQNLTFAPVRRRPKILTSTCRQAPVCLDPLVRRQGDTVFYGDQPVDVFRGAMFGIAVDLGTTTIVLDFVNLETGESVHQVGIENPQRFGGSDVMTRISYDAGPHHGRLRKVTVNALNAEIKAFCQAHGADRHQIYEVIVAGNSTMRDLFFGVDIQPIGQRPYQSKIEQEYRLGLRQTTALTEFAHRLGVLAHPKARVFGPPLVASHVGADTTADLLAIDIEKREETFLLVDVGTNTEVVLAHRGRFLAASCPAGPAFEGRGIRFGMPGAEGAIERIWWTSQGWRYQVIGDVAPQGICGSGLIDLLAELRRNGLMSPKGVFLNRSYEIPIAPEYGITFSREDASHLAQAKAANYCGQFILLRALGVDPSQIDKLYLAGGFANSIQVANAVEIGFLAPVPEQRVVKIGNGALEGARQMLLSQSKRASVERILKRIEHVELETTPDFFEIFVEACQFKPMSIPKGTPQ